MTKKDWWIFFSVQLFVHIFIDAFNAYGTGWFEPFSHYRVAFHVLFVADPFFSVWLAIAFVALLLLRSGHAHRKRWAWGGLAGSCLYLCYCICNKLSTDAHARADLQGKSYTRYLSTPTPLNNWLWYVVAETNDGFYTGYHSVFDHRPVQFRFQPKNRSLLHPFLEHTDVRYLVRFSQGFYTVERWGDTTVFNDLRFGEMKGWEDPKARFVFHYFLEYPDNNKIVVQRGRFAGWSWHTAEAMIHRIRGN
jgi:inner membrane protein